MRKFNVAVAGIAMMCVGAVGFVSPASAQRKPTFQNSCTGYVFAIENQAAGIKAKCKTKAGAEKMSFVPLRSIDNIDGRLSHVGGPKAATFHKSCTKATVSPGGKSGIKLTALCKKRDGQAVMSETNIWDIDNIDGNLRYYW